MRIQFFITAFISLFSLCLNGQGNVYSTAVGLRLGSPSSISLKKFISSESALEAYVGYRSYSLGYNWVTVSGAFQKHKEITELDGLQWYYGGGASVYFWSYDRDLFFENSRSTTVGVQGYIGLDYRIPGIPLSVTLDWIPTLFINGFTSGFGGGYGSLGVRYILSE